MTSHRLQLTRPCADDLTGKIAGRIAFEEAQEEKCFYCGQFRQQDTSLDHQLACDFMYVHVREIAPKHF